uniref:Protein DDB_G0276689 isoform X9 n=1 Tax=Tanacetum cinerariifolium TaxID=118510 RepID=A0A6L2JP56_TANCI|nr:protein DDB_G0276689 isoform X9 [Tanacetum cinerariifolium]
MGEERIAKSQYPRLVVDEFLPLPSKGEAGKDGWQAHQLYTDDPAPIIQNIINTIEGSPPADVSSLCSIYASVQSLSGMYISMIETARSDANSTEFDEHAPILVVIFMPEVNPEVVEDLEKTGLRFFGKDENNFNDADSDSYLLDDNSRVSFGSSIAGTLGSFT